MKFTILHGYATIQLTRGQNTLIDARDYERFVGRKWHAHPSHGEYYAMRTAKDGQAKKRTIRMHRVVLETHVGTCPPGHECRHLNGDSLDNRSGNLAWGTPSENSQDAVRHGTRQGLTVGRPNLGTRGERNRSARLTAEQIPEIFKCAAAGESSASLGKRFGVSRVAIYKIFTYRSWTHVSLGEGA